MMSKHKKDMLVFSFNWQNHSITDREFFHWLTDVFALMVVTILSRMFLLTIPISLLAGFINLQGGVFSKFSLKAFI